MTQWEYKMELRMRALGAQNVGMAAVQKSSSWDIDMELKLPELGKEGWELVSVVPRSGFHGNSTGGTTTEELWIFKRPLA